MGFALVASLSSPVQFVTDLIVRNATDIYDIVVLLASIVYQRHRYPTPEINIVSVMIANRDYFTVTVRWPLNISFRNNQVALFHL